MSIETLLEQMRLIAATDGVPILRDESEPLILEAVKVKKPRRILEIGTAIGYSALLLSTVMPPDASITTIELDPARADIARDNVAKAQLSERICVITGDALAILPALSGEFDFVFLDGPKGQYLSMLNLLLDKLVPGAVIIADNVLFRGMVDTAEEPPRRYRTLVRRLREYLAYVLTNPAFSTTLLPIGDGVAISYFKENKS